MDQLLKKKKTELLHLASVAKLDVNESMTKNVLAGKLMLSAIPDRKSYKFENLKKADLELLCKADDLNIKSAKTKQELIDLLCNNTSSEPLPDLPRDVIGVILEKIKDPIEARRIAKILDDAYSLRRISDSEAIKTVEVRLVKNHFTLQRKDYPSTEVFEATVGAWLQLLLYSTYMYLMDREFRAPTLPYDNYFTSNPKIMIIRLTDFNDNWIEIRISHYANYTVYAKDDTLIAKLECDHIVRKNVMTAVSPVLMDIFTDNTSYLRMLRWMKFLNFTENGERLKLEQPRADIDANNMLKSIRKEIRADSKQLQPRIDEVLRNGLSKPPAAQFYELNDGLYSLYPNQRQYNHKYYAFMFTKKENEEVYVPIVRPVKEKPYGPFTFVTRLP